MLSKNQIKNITTLHSKKERSEAGLFIIEGDKLVAEALDSSYTIETIYALSAWLDENDRKIKDSNTKLVDVTADELKKISLLSTANNVLAVCKQKQFDLDISLFQDKLSLYLDDIRDPGNLGTIIRLAHWFGIPQIICSPETVEFYNPKAVQSTMGSIFHVNLVTMDLGEVLVNNGENKPAKVFGALLEGENIYLKDNFTSGILVIGNESNGISSKNLKFISDKIKIPPASENHAESLNAAMATSIFLSEYLRRKKYFKKIEKTLASHKNVSTFAPPFERRCLCGSSDKEGLKKKDLKFLNIFLEIKKRLLLLHPNRTR
ncbi:MAG: RNA methyltransferase [Bacteroidetes bacterium]|nr:RNA methyltransferase [Bacteroidota bacterium]